MTWPLAVALMVGAVVFVVLPLLRQRPGTAEDGRSQKHLASVYQARKQELARENQDNAVPEAVAAALLEELDGALLDDIRQPVVQSAAASAAPRWLVGALIVLVPVCGFLIYRGVGDPQADQLAGAGVIMRLPAGDPALARWTGLLEARVEARPGEAESWYLLGHAQLKQSAFSEAAAAFAQTHKLRGEDQVVDSYWLQARFLAAGGVLDPTSERLAERLLEQDPSNNAVAELLAVAHFRRGDFAESRMLLNRAINGARNPAAQIALLGLLRQVEEQVPATAPAINVNVTAEGEVPREATIFVTATPVGGGMPFAVARRPAALLPFTVRMDDANSMNPAVPLSMAGEVQITVRLSRSGEVMRTPTDWVWQSGAIVAAGRADVASVDAQLTPPSQ